MKVSLAPLLASLPRQVTAKWPDGEPFASAIEHGTMSLEVLAPRGHALTDMHTQDELYLVVAGSATLLHAGERMKVTVGDAMLVPAGDEHSFEQTSTDFVTWVVFWGPKGGER